MSANDRPNSSAEDASGEPPVTDEPQSVDAAADAARGAAAAAEPAGGCTGEPAAEPAGGSGGEPAAEPAGGSGGEPEAQSAGGSGGEPEAQSAEAGSGAEPAPREPTALELLTAERDQHLNDLQRVTAEFANFRKQTEKRNAQTVQQAAAGVMQAILPVLDACDAAALQHVEGVEPITAQLRSVLEAQGLEIIDQTEPFDPNRHEAAMSEPGDEDQTEPMVSAVLRTGYVFNGRVLRAAMVKVKG
ncbi:MAG: nucleotide exchange factor GrpE [Acidimicrobiaceae bacterium]|nr:nucleotide exchange factor GrpE [Acidimicrobiia bacterium]MCY4493752.1 nucleotide exchange factor GrpE [Acidimicrobiaceae bacterium]